MDKNKIFAFILYALPFCIFIGNGGEAPLATFAIFAILDIAHANRNVQKAVAVLHIVAVAACAAWFKIPAILIPLILLPHVLYNVTEDIDTNFVKTGYGLITLGAMCSIGFAVFKGNNPLDEKLPIVVALTAILYIASQQGVAKISQREYSEIKREKKELEAEVTKLKTRISEQKAEDRMNNYLSVILGLEFEGFSEDENIDRVMKTIDSAVHPVFCGYYVADKGMRAFVLSRNMGRCNAFGKREEFGLGFIGEVYNSKHFSYISALLESTTDEYRKEQLNGVNCAMAFPIVVNDEVTGAFVIGTGVMTEAEEQNLTNICSIISNKVNTEFSKMREHKEVTDKSITDKLTGLYNRLYFDEIFPQLFKQAQEQGTNIAYVLIDLDFFKQMNDTHGHAFGDKVLQTAAKTFIENIRKSDYAFRTGGDEFSLVLPGATADAARHVATKIAKEYEKKVEREKLYAKKDGQPVRSSFSIGIASFPGFKAETPQELVKKADSAVYYVKEHGKNNIAVAGGK